MKSLKVFLASFFIGYSTTALANNHDIISSDGSIPPSVDISSTLIERGSIGGASALISTDANIKSISTSEIAHLKTLRGYRSNYEAEAIWGLDTRVQLKPTTYPYRAIVLIATDTLLCTGAMIGTDTLLTAGHCVHSGGSNGNWASIENITVYPGADGKSFPYGKCTAKRTYTTIGWAEKGSANYDYGAIKLNCSIGNTIGWLGFAVFNNAANLPAIIAGYPGEKDRTQWVSFDTIRQQKAEWLIYSNDTTAGMSGAPIWYDDGKGAITFGIHTYKFPKTNRGKRINAEVFKNIKTWKNAQ